MLCLCMFDHFGSSCVCVQLVCLCERISVRTEHSRTMLHTAHSERKQLRRETLLIRPPLTMCVIHGECERDKDMK